MIVDITQGAATAIIAARCRFPNIRDVMSNIAMEKPQDTDARLTELEIKVSLADDLLDQLSDTIYRQQQQIERLARELVELREQLPEEGTPGPRSLRDELPPHY